MSCCSSCASGAPCESEAVGAGLASGAPREVRQVDDALSAVWNLIRPVVPYGNLVDEAHRARRRLMWGDETPPPAPAPARVPAPAPARPTPTAPGDATIRLVQRVVRRASSGHAEEAATLRAWKVAASSASSSPSARRRWKMAVAVMRDDDARIKRRHAERLRFRASVAAALPSILSSPSAPRLTLRFLPEAR